MNVNLYELMDCRIHFVIESLTSHAALCLFCGRVFVNLTSVPDSFSNALRLVAGGIHQPLDSEWVALPIVAGLGPLISRSTRRQPARAHARALARAPMACRFEARPRASRPAPLPLAQRQRKLASPSRRHWPRCVARAARAASDTACPPAGPTARAAAAAAKKKSTHHWMLRTFWPNSSQWSNQACRTRCGDHRPWTAGWA